MTRPWRVREWILGVIAVTGIIISCLNLTVSFNKEIDWDMAFWLGFLSVRHQVSNLHPLLGSILWFYEQMSSLIADNLLSLQLLFAFFIFLGAGLYGLLFKRLFNNTALALLSVCAYSLFPLIQNLAAFYEDNLIKLPFLLGVLLLIFWGEGKKNIHFLYFAIALFVYAVFLSFDSLLWLPVVAALILWKAFSEGEYSLKAKGLFVCKCMALGIVCFGLLSVAQDVAYKKPLGSEVRDFYNMRSFPVEFAGEAFKNGRGDVSRPISYFFEQLGPLVGLKQVLIESEAGSSADSRNDWKWIAIAWKRYSYFLFPVLAFHLFNGWILLLAARKAVKKSDKTHLVYIGIVGSAYIAFFGFNYFYIDFPNERYDHYFILLPLLLNCLNSGKANAGGMRVEANKNIKFSAGVLTVFIFMGLVHFATNPYQKSDLYRAVRDKPSGYQEYFFSIEELSGTQISEAYYLAGYRPLKIINTDGREGSLFGPVYMDRESKGQILARLKRGDKKIYLSPKMREYLLGEK